MSEIGSRHKTRSPRAPDIAFPEALRLARLIHDAEGTHPLTEEVASKLIGHSTATGASRAKLAALKRYGLLEKHESDLRVTSDARHLLLLEEGCVEWRERAVRAAMSPQIFQQMRALFAENGPLPSADNMQRQVQLKLGFSPAGARTVVPAFRDTLQFVEQNSLDDEADLENIPPNIEPVATATGGSSASPSNPYSPPGASGHSHSADDWEAVFQLGGGVKVSLRSEVELSPKQLRKLAKVIELTAQFEEDEDDDE